ncbi:MAG: mechanosensitive ion channel [Muribaculaceae bacterium]|nr:mechanosensitive ion channel [Muribaculaceae bacterium]
MLLLQDPITLVNDSVPSVHEELHLLRSMPFDDFMNTVIQSLIKFSINLAIAIFVFYVGKIVVKKLYNLAHNIMVRREVDRSLQTFVLSMIRIVLYFILIVTVIGIMGIETSSFLALFGAAGVAIGMALSGTLQNFAGGVLILMLKPYKVGDYIETQGYAGYVREIQIFHTIICTYDNKSIILPNGGLSTGSINNWSREDYRRIDWTISISYGDDVEQARKAIMNIFASDDRIVKQYIEDDRAMRECQENQAEPLPADVENTEQVLEDCEEQTEPVRKPWYNRLLHYHRKRVNKKIQEMRDKAEEAAQSQMEKIDRGPTVTLDNLNSSSVDLKARAWARTEFYWPVFYEVNERIYNELPKAGLHFPFPQMDVHISQQ